MTEGRSGALTPGRVFCSWRALWAFSADSLAQYVRKAHPALSGRQERDGFNPQWATIYDQKRSETVKGTEAVLRCWKEEHTPCCVGWMLGKDFIVDDKTWHSKHVVILIISGLQPFAPVKYVQPVKYQSWREKKHIHFGFLPKLYVNYTKCIFKRIMCNTFPLMFVHRL